jgi:hypothetical protein
MKKSHRSKNYVFTKCDAEIIILLTTQLKIPGCFLLYSNSSAVRLAPIYTALPWMQQLTLQIEKHKQHDNITSHSAT